MAGQGEDKSRRGYHHGNLRAALIEAALGLIERQGANGFSFAEAARAAGVSPAAPYRHFKDRDALLSEIALVGFQRFADHLERALDSSGPSAMRAFEAVTSAYLEFARTERAYFVAMFQSGIPATSEVSDASQRALSVLHRAAEGLVRHLPASKRPPIHMMSYHIWAMSHGIAELFGDGETAQRAPIAAGDLLEAGAAIYLRGLGLIPEN